MTSLPSLRKGLLRHPFIDQVLVYDTTQNRVHLLDGTTASVVDSLERGDSADAITAKLCRQQGTDGGSQLLALALDELARAELTESSAGTAAPMPEITRRQMLAKFAGIGAAVLIPAIVSLSPNTVSAQGSPLQCGQACTLTAQCPGTTRPTCHCCKIGGMTDGTCSTELSGNCQPA
jgi:hypothetical protein